MLFLVMTSAFAQPSPSLFPNSNRQTAPALGGNASGLFPKTTPTSPGLTTLGDIPSASPADPKGVIAETAPPMAVPAPPSATKENSTRATGSLPGPELPTSDPADLNQSPSDPFQKTARPGPLRPKDRPKPQPPATPHQTGTPQPMKCVDPSQVPDADIARNLATFFNTPTLCLEIDQLVEHGRQWRLMTITNTANRQGPGWALLQDNADNAFDAALYGVSRYGGALIMVRGIQNRDLAQQDPNRNFGATMQATATCNQMITKPAPAFTNMINRHFQGRSAVFALHTNPDGHFGNGGNGHISAARNTDKMRGFPATLPAPGLSDEDNAILIAGLTPYETASKTQSLVQHMGQLGINVIYEQINPAGHDCSLATHRLLNKLGPFYSIESENDRLNEQKSMLDALLDYLGIPPVS